MWSPVRYSSDLHGRAPPPSTPPFRQREPSRRPEPIRPPGAWVVQVSKMKFCLPTVALPSLKRPGQEYGDVGAAALIKGADEIGLHDLPGGGRGSISFDATVFGSVFGLGTGTGERTFPSPPIIEMAINSSLRLTLTALQ